MPDTVLFDFEGEFDFSTVEARSVKVSGVDADGGQALRMGAAHDQRWPGITLVAPKGKWDLTSSEAVEIGVTNVGEGEPQVGLRVDNPGADGAKNCVQVIEGVKPGETITIRAELIHPLTDKGGNPIELFGMRGYPGGGQGQRAFDPSNVTQVLVFLSGPEQDHSLLIDDLRAVGEYDSGIDSVDNFFPMIDEFGQYIHRDWPGKVHSAEELQANIDTEAQDLAAHPGPENWNEYGGWESGPTLEATGFFRAEKHEGKWWLVDPTGKLFISHGSDCVNAGGDSTPLEDREHWYAGLPDTEGPFGQFFGKGRSIHYYYEGRTVRTFDHSAANLRRKYGEQWRDVFSDITHRRLRSWGINTIANWSSSGIYLQRKTSYVATIHFGGKMLEGSQGYWGKFRDVFDPSFTEAIETRMAGEAETTAGDPWCIGYFVDNEIAWGDQVSLANAALASPPEQVAKQVFIDDLKDKYETIDRLNETWGTEHGSWEAMLESTELPDRDRAKADLEAFYSKTADTYFRVIRDAVKAVAPEQMYLGCRFAWVNPLAAAAAVEHCDVVSYNLYRRSVDNFFMPGDWDVPLIIGEFHFGALDRGLFHTGLVSVEDQQARADLYREYVRGMLRHPQFVGCHWFKYRDESTTGRPLDAENYQIGFIDICDTPYPETIDAVRDVGYGMYDYRMKGE